MERRCKKTVGRGREDVSFVLFMRKISSLVILKMPTPSALGKLFCSCGTWKNLPEVLSVRAYSLSPSQSMMSAGGNCENKKKALPLKGTEAFTSFSPRVTLLLWQILELNFPFRMIRPFL